MACPIQPIVRPKAKRTRAESTGNRMACAKTTSANQAQVSHPAFPTAAGMTNELCQHRNCFGYHISGNHDRVRFYMPSRSINAHCDQKDHGDDAHDGEPVPELRTPSS